MDQLKFVRAMKARQLLGITIVSFNHVCSGVGFTGTYKHVYGTNIREEITDATVLAIADDLKAMQSASRLIVGKFFYATMNIGYEKMTAEIFYDEQFAGEDYKREIHEQFLGHPWRRDARAMKNWNIACDKTINTELQDAGFILPEDAYYSEGEEIGKSSEWIFARMREDEKPEPEEDGEGKGTPDPLGELRDAPNGLDDKGDPSPTEQEWKERVIGAMSQAKLAGKLPGGMVRALQQALKPRLDIRSLLLRFFSERAMADYSWSKPNTRYIAQGLYLPSLESHSLGNVAIMVDTSGSIDETSLDYARGIVESVIEECNPSSVTVYYADAAVCGVERFEQGEPLKWEPIGGGGTNFIPVLERIQKDDEAVCALCITDLDGTFPKESPSIPVVWLATTERIAPFGETITLDR